MWGSSLWRTSGARMRSCARVRAASCVGVRDGCLAYHAGGSVLCVAMEAGAMAERRTQSRLHWPRLVITRSEPLAPADEKLKERGRGHEKQCTACATPRMMGLSSRGGPAADDGIMPQTREALGHARAAGCPVVVALTKCDREDADVARARRQLLSEGLELEEVGGDVQVRPPRVHLGGFCLGDCVGGGCSLQRCGAGALCRGTLVYLTSACRCVGRACHHVGV